MQMETAKRVVFKKNGAKNVQIWSPSVIDRSPNK